MKNWVKSLNSLHIGIHYIIICWVQGIICLYGNLAWRICLYINKSLDSFDIMRKMIEQLKVPVLFEPYHLHSVRQGNACSWKSNCAIRKIIVEVYSCFHTFIFMQLCCFEVLKLVTCLMSTSGSVLHEHNFFVVENNAIYEGDRMVKQIVLEIQLWESLPQSLTPNTHTQTQSPKAQMQAYTHTQKEFFVPYEQTLLYKATVFRACEK